VQVGSSSPLSGQFQELESAAVGKYQDGQDFNFILNEVAGNGGGASSSSGAATAAGGYSLSGGFQSGSLIAVGTMSNGRLQPFSSQQIQSEESALTSMGQTAYADSLQNFLSLAQASSLNGQIGACSYNDQQQFCGDNGLISASFDTNLSLNPASAGTARGAT
jgi:hypothetical protein